jgi:large subunit ribosomal protein L33
MKKNILICSYCLSRNYDISVNKKEKSLILKKYCPKCNKHILHEESK